VNTPPYSVAVIVDPQAGDKIRAIAEQFDIWVVPSPANSPVASQLQRKRVGVRPSTQVSIWSHPFDPQTESDWCAVIDDVELHHGEYSHDPPVSTIEIFGAKMSAAAQKAFRLYGFDLFQDTESGFRASKPKAV